MVFTFAVCYLQYTWFICLLYRVLHVIMICISFIFYILCVRGLYRGVMNKQPDGMPKLMTLNSVMAVISRWFTEFSFEGQLRKSG